MESQWIDQGKLGECGIAVSKRRKCFKKERVVTWVKTVEMVDGDRKMTVRFPNRKVTADLYKRGEF